MPSRSAAWVWFPPQLSRVWVTIHRLKDSIPSTRVLSPAISELNGPSEVAPVPPPAGMSSGRRLSSGESTSARSRALRSSRNGIIGIRDTASQFLAQTLQIMSYQLGEVFHTLP